MHIFLFLGLTFGAMKLSPGNSAPPSPASVMDEITVASAMPMNAKSDNNYPCSVPSLSVRSWLPSSFRACGVGVDGHISSYVVDEDEPMRVGACCGGFCSGDDTNGFVVSDNGLSGFEVEIKDGCDAHLNSEAHSDCLKTPPRSSPSSEVVAHSPMVLHKRITVAEAYNKDLMLQFILSPAKRGSWNWGCTRGKFDYETNWKGHQPLTPETWSTNIEPGANESSRIAASEIRLMRRRRRRGLITPQRPINGNVAKLNPHVTSPPKVSRRGPTEQAFSDNSVLGKNSNISNDARLSTPFPKDVVVPRLGQKAMSLINVNSTGIRF